MATLTEVSAVARKGVVIGAIALVILMLIPPAWAIFKRLTFKPPPPPPPTVLYNKLPALNFPDRSDVATPEYKLETISGGFPQFPDRAKVYPSGFNKSRLLTIERFAQRAQNLGLVADPIKISDVEYQFTHARLPGRLRVNVVDNLISYGFDWTSDPSISKSNNVPVSQVAIDEARQWLSRVVDVPDDIRSGEGKFGYYVATGSAIFPIDIYSVRQANFTRVDLFRASLDNLPFVTIGVDTSPVNVTFSGLTGEKRVTSANFYYSQIEQSSFSTYPLIRAEQAWEELKQGKGFVARPVEKAVVRKVYLAYFESAVFQQFVQPVYVFEGDGGFVAYVPAVDRPYYGN